MAEPPNPTDAELSSPTRSSNAPFSPDEVGSSLSPDGSAPASQTPPSPATATDSGLARNPSAASSLGRGPSSVSQDARSSATLSNSQKNQSYRSSMASTTSALGRASSTATNRSSNRLSTATSGSAVSRASSVNTNNPRAALRPAGARGVGNSSPSRNMSTVSEASSQARTSGSESGELPLSVPSKTDSLFSGFPYRQALFDLGLPPKQWEQFNDELQTALNPSTLDKVSQKFQKVPTIPLGLFFLSRYALNAASNRQMDKKMIKSLSDDVGGDRIDGFAATLDRWNADVFNALGLDITIQLSSAALSRANKEDRKRREKERKTREKYGTAGFYEEDDNSSLGSKNAEKRYKLLVQHYEGPDLPPQYTEGNTQGLVEAPDNENNGAIMLDSKPVGQDVAEVEGSAPIAELPADLSALELQGKEEEGKETGGERKSVSPTDKSPTSPQEAKPASPKVEINPAMHQEGDFLPVELPG